MILEYGAELGVEEFVIGMAHRGRLNVLANILGKTYSDIFAEFEGKAFGSDEFSGDVKYHMGYSSDKKVRSGKKVHLSLTPNPSHLEAVNPTFTVSPTFIFESPSVSTTSGSPSFSR